MMGDRLGQQLGNYRLLRRLGRGGFAEVYLGEHLYLKTKAAVKVLDGKLTERDVQAFKKEAQTIAALKHPHILRVLDFGFGESTPFLVMEYASHGTLRNRHPRASVLSPFTVAAYVKPVAAALQYAHTMKIIHRDVKPENILIDEQQMLLLSDFGIAALSHSTASMKTVDSSGTPHYMAPEQFQGKPCEASDQYALAIMVYEWLTGQLPFQGDTFFSLGMQHLLTPLPSLNKINPSIPREIEPIVSKALAKDPKERFSSIQDFAVTLEQTLQFTENASTTYIHNPFDQEGSSIRSKNEPPPVRSIRPMPLPITFPEPLQKPSSVEKTSHVLPASMIRSSQESSITTKVKQSSFLVREQMQRFSKIKNLRKRRLWIVIGLSIVILGLILVPALFLVLHSGNSSSNSNTNIFQMDAVVGHSDSPTHPSTFLAFDLQGCAVIIEIRGGDPSRSDLYVGPRIPNSSIPVTLNFQDVTGDHLLDMIIYIGSAKTVFVNDGTSFRRSTQNDEIPNEKTLPGPVSSNVHYPLSWTEAVVGHNDSTTFPSVFLTMNLRGQLIIFEARGGDPTRGMTYIGPDLVLSGDDQLLATLTFSDVNHDSKVDMILHIEGSDKTFVFYNDGTTFAPYGK